MADSDIVAREGRSYGFRDGRGQDWTESWHPPELQPPDGRPHGSGGMCFTPVGAIVLVTQDGASWEFPAGRPEGDEDWRETLDREMLEEACAVVEDATLLGYARGTCLAGFEAGLVLVRSLWVAEVTLQPWRPRHETTGRMLVRPETALDTVRPGNEPIARRWLREALATREGRERSRIGQGSRTGEARGA